MHQREDSTVWGGIEAGGTKFVCAVGTGPDDLRAEARIPTTWPEATIEQAIQFLQGYPEPLTAVGIGSFGPLSPDPYSPTFGHITSTPKPGWENTNLVGPIQSALGIPVGFDTDVNAAALGEQRWGAAQGLETFIYLTVGTGIGGGGMVDGNLIHGLMHPEMGHVYVPHDKGRDPFPGTCPFHGDCLEGLASGPALQERWRKPAKKLPPNHRGWQLEAEYLAHGLVNYICTLSPQRIILGGGVMEQSHLFPMVQKRVQGLLSGYLQHSAILERIDEYIVPPVLGRKAGVLGAIVLAQRAAERQDWHAA